MLRMFQSTQLGTPLGRERYTDKPKSAVRQAAGIASWSQADKQAGADKGSTALASAGTSSHVIFKKPRVMCVF